MVKRVWTNEEKQGIIEMFNNGTSFKELSKEYNAHYNTLKKVLEDAGINTSKKRRWKQHEIDDIVYKFTEEHCTMKDLTKIHSTNIREIRDILQRQGIDTAYYARRSVNRGVNTDFFKVIDTEEKAYILGLMMADGNVGYGKGNQLYMKLELIDLDLIQKVQKAINSDSVITISDRNRDFIINENKTYSFSVYSHKLVSELLKYGIVPNKTYKTDWLTDDVPQELRRHYLRGLFDGDGCIRRKSNTQWSITLTNNHPEFLRQVQKWIEELTGIEPLTISKTSTSYSIIYTCAKAKKLIHYLYHDNNISLDRKQILADQAVRDIV